MTAPPMIDPRIEERRVEVQRAARSRRMRIALLCAGAFVVLGAAWLAVQSPLLDVDHVTVVGARRVPPDAIVRAAAVHHGDPLLRVDTSVVARRVERLAWIASARVQRSLPGTLRIVVTEHRATAYVRRPDGRVALVAADGRVFTDVAAPVAGAVEIRGLPGVPRVGGVLAPDGVADLVPQLPSRLAAQVTAIEVTRDGVTLDLARGQVRLGGVDALDAKGAAALAVMDRLGERRFTYVDVRAPQWPVEKQ